jgi:undecaprenyl diphosphate synthase
MINKAPNHIAIIMDGNRRWAKKKGLQSFQGHKFGVDALREIVKYSGEIGIKYLTVFAFSTENIGRSKLEVRTLFSLLIRALKEEVKDLSKNNVRLNFIGETGELPKKLQTEIKRAEEFLGDNAGLNLCVALNYGGKREIVEAAKKSRKITEEEITKNLYTKNMPNPDLIIRTGGVKRLSNFLLWQSDYAELYFSDILWPDFTKKDLDKAILDYNDRERRFGK